jgi:hypothetical protein
MLGGAGALSSVFRPQSYGNAVRWLDYADSVYYDRVALKPTHCNGWASVTLRRSRQCFLAPPVW